MSKMSKHAFDFLLLLLEQYEKSGKQKTRFYSFDYPDVIASDFSIDELEKRGYIIKEVNVADSILLTELAISELENIKKHNS